MTKARDLANSAAAFSAVSATELGYVDGVTSAIQTQLDAKAASSTAVTLTGTQTLTNKTLTNPVIASVVNNTLTSTTGDMIYASAANTPARLGIGSSAQVLTVAGGVPSWATPAGGGGMTQILAPTSIVSSPTQNTFTTSSISGSYNQLVIYIKDFKADNYFGLSIRFNSDATADAYQSASLYASNSVAAYGESYRGTYGMIFNNLYGNTDDNFAMITIPNYANTTTRKVAYGNAAYVADDTNFANQIGAVSWKNTAAISTITLYTVDSGYSSGKWTGGTIEIYGVN